MSIKGQGLRELEPNIERNELLFMRHPQTEGNARMQFVGQVNTPLTPLGYTQRAQAEEALLAYKPDRVISSPLNRCLAIAEPVAEKLGVKLTVDRRIIEMGFGKLEGKTYQEAVEAGLAFFPWGEQAHRWPETGGEPIEDLTRRIEEFCEEASRFPGKTAIICHGGIIRVVMGYFLQLQPTQYWKMTVQNVNATLFSTYDGIANLEAFGLSPHEVYERYNKKD